MNSFTASVAHCVRHLTRFSGRDRPRVFWPFAGLVVGLSYLFSMLITLPAMLPIMQRAFEVARTSPGMGPPGRYPGGAVDPSAMILSELPEMTRAILLPTAVLMLLTCLLLAAAATRRLHDRDRTGLVGLLPIPFAIPGLLLLPDYMESLQRLGTGEPLDPTPILLLMGLNILYLCALAFLIYHLVSAGTTGPNRYGPDPIDPRDV